MAIRFVEMVALACKYINSNLWEFVRKYMGIWGFCRHVGASAVKCHCTKEFLGNTCETPAKIPTKGTSIKLQRFFF